MANIYKLSKGKDIKTVIKRLKTLNANIKTLLNNKLLSEHEKEKIIKKFMLYYTAKRQAATEIGHFLSRINKKNRKHFFKANIDAFSDLFAKSFSFDQKPNNNKNLNIFLDKLYSEYTALQEQNEIYKDYDERLTLIFNGKGEDIFFNLILGNLFTYDEDDLYYDEDKEDYYLDLNKQYKLLKPVKGKRISSAPPKNSMKEGTYSRKIYDQGAHEEIAIKLREHPLVKKIIKQFSAIFLSKDLKELKNFNQFIPLTEEEKKEAEKNGVTNYFLNKTGSFYYLLNTLQKEAITFISKPLYEIIKRSNQTNEAEITDADKEACRLKVVIAENYNDDLFIEPEERAIRLLGKKYKEIYLSTSMIKEEIEIKAAIANQAYLKHIKQKIKGEAETKTKDDPSNGNEPGPYNPPDPNGEHSSFPIGNIDQIIETHKNLLNAREYLIFNSVFISYDEKNNKLLINKDLYKKFVLSQDINQHLEKTLLNEGKVNIGYPFIILINKYKVSKSLGEIPGNIIDPEATIENINKNYNRIRKDFAPIFKSIKHNSPNNNIRENFNKFISGWIMATSIKEIILNIMKNYSIKKEEFTKIYRKFILDKDFITNAEEALYKKSEDLINVGKVVDSEILVENFLREHLEENSNKNRDNYLFKKIDFSDFELNMEINQEENQR